MGFSTFSGPLRSGTERYGAGRNTGVAVLTQAKTINMAGVALTSAPPVQNLFTLPAGSKIISIIADKTVALTGNSISQVAMIVGNASDDNQYLESVNLATTKGRAAQATVDAGLQVDDCENIGTSDVLLQAVHGDHGQCDGGPDCCHGGLRAACAGRLCRSVAGLILTPLRGRRVTGATHGKDEL